MMNHKEELLQVLEILNRSAECHQDLDEIRFAVIGSKKQEETEISKFKFGAKTVLEDFKYLEDLVRNDIK